MAVLKNLTTEMLTRSERKRRQNKSKNIACRLTVVSLVRFDVDQRTYRGKEKDGGSASLVNNWPRARRVCGR